MNPVASCSPEIRGVKRRRETDPLYRATLAGTKALILDPNYLSRKKICLLKSHPLSKVIEKKCHIIPDLADFDINLGHEIPVENQANAGNCMLIAILNLIRRAVFKKYGIKDFRLSKNYLLYYSCLVKASNILKGGLKQSASIEEGFDFDDLRFLIQRHGVVPYDSMPDTYHTTSPRAFYSTINNFLRKLLVEIDTGLIDSNEALNQFATLLMKFLGLVPQLLKVKLGKINKMIQPHSFLSTVIPEFDFSDLWTIIAKDSSRVSFAKPNYIYLKIDHFIQALINSLKGGCPVILSYQELDHAKIVYKGKNKIKSYNSFDYLGISKKENQKITRLFWKYSDDNHAAALIGVHFDDKKKPKYWLLENSWGENHGINGYDVIPHECFVDHIFEAVVQSSFLDGVYKPLSG